MEREDRTYTMLITVVVAVAVVVNVVQVCSRSTGTVGSST